MRGWFPLLASIALAGACSVRREVQVCKIYKKDISVARQEQTLEAMIKLLKSSETLSKKKVAEKK